MSSLPWAPPKLAPRVERLDSGLTVCLLEGAPSSLVVTALWYRAGARHELPGEEGLAHFLEHMMFKGSRRYPEGEVDRLTMAAGGVNNAFTSHDATAYHFAFSSDRWPQALAIEADRMAGLTLAPDAVERERRVILEELSELEDDPWDALEMAVVAELFGAHPYGRPILGTRASLLAAGPSDLAAFHRRHYRPDNAVLVLAGEITGGDLARVEGHFAGLSRPPGEPVGAPRAEQPPSGGERRVERRRGELDRMELALPAPPADDSDYAALRLLGAVLGGGRASRLHLELVEERRLCSWVSVELAECVEPGCLTIVAEALPGASPAAIETAVLGELEALRRCPPAEGEVERARRLLLADWIFGSERVHQQALIVGQAAALFDLGFPERALEAVATCGVKRLAETAARYLDPGAGSVTGWSRAGEGAV